MRCHCSCHITGAIHCVPCCWKCPHCFDNIVGSQGKHFQTCPGKKFWDKEREAREAGNTNRLGDENGLLNRRGDSETSALGGSTPSVSANPNGLDTIIKFEGEVPKSVAEHCEMKDLEIIEEKSKDR